MSFDWTEYVYLAEELLLNGTGESCFRCSISRAYYGAFCNARDAKGCQDIAHDVHKRVIALYENSDDTNEKLIGRTLKNLKKTRIDADYYKEKCLTKEHAERSINRAKSILDRMGIPYNP